MSENKDLEIIKIQPRASFDYEDMCYRFDEEQWEKAIDAAERMAAEIERLKEENTKLKAEMEESCIYTLEGDLYIAKQEMARLKAELEKRAEVIRCGECKKQETEECPRRHWDENYICYFGPENNDYCSAGVRRESEENNEI